jgi:flagellum-specific ATP synthase
VDGSGRRHLGEVIGFRGSHVLSMPLSSCEGIRLGDPVAALGMRPQIEVGEALIGRVLDAMGEPIDGGRRPSLHAAMPLDGVVPKPLERVPIGTPLGTGIRAIDGLLTVGRGQRVGIFGGSGVGKSTLIGMMTRNSEAEAIVVGLVGERGREVGEFLEDSLGERGRRRSVVLVSTSDQSPLLRMRAALGATCVAEYFARQGKSVLLVLDSLTRFAMAAREVGLAAGEPPTAKGYTPSVFNRLARLIERAGQFERGSITAFYTAMAAEGWYPPIQVLDSISRLMPAVATAEHKQQAALARKLLAVYARSEDLVRIGAYKPGADADLDRALRSRTELRRYLEQDAKEDVTAAKALDQLAQLAARI